MVLTTIYFQNMPIDIQYFKQGIFALNTRRFGKVAELMVKKMIGADDAPSISHDLILSVNKHHRIEVKFSRFLRKHNSVITESNVIEQILSTTSENRMVDSEDIFNIQFDCNIQQVKPIEFDTIYYGLFCQDKVLIFRANSHEVIHLPNYSDKQHRGNKGEGQFHLNQDTIHYHYQHHLYRTIDYQELFYLLNNVHLKII